MILTIRPAQMAEAEWISTRLRPEDATEVQTATGMTPKEVLPVSLSLSQECYTVRLNRKFDVVDYPAAIFGLAPDPMSSKRGVVWMLCTPEIRHCTLALIRESGFWLDHFESLYPEGIHNYVDARNELHVRWCVLTGFKLGALYMRNGFPFHHAFRKRT